ncbi:MAG TPA: glycosyltransferase family 1 protein [Candidatus Sulfotelmatobacter sp.]|jgi:glycosyltransferase involved in cell wall biosynthesis|nr:glycosyltransferase family 1 protein [Candidatus Sulfotelmatobacter sp.]
MPPVKIAIDIRRMTEFGVGTYIRNVVRTLGRLDRETTYLLIGSPDKVKEIGALPSNFHAVPLAEPERSLKSFREFRTVVKRLECDLVHIPNLFSVPRALPCPYVMTVHDILEHLSRAREQTGFWRSLHFGLTRQVLHGAARILAVSNFTKLEIEKLFNIPPGRIEVVYNAIDERLLRGNANPSDRQLIVERYQVTYPFLLYAGRISPHKNVVRMIEAFSALKTELEKDQLYPDLKLIIIGDDVSGNPDLRRTVIRSGVQNDVRFLGFVPIEVLRTFYDAAKIFVFPSLYEGFGLPPLEAMAHGTPVVTSNVSSLPEVVGNAAVLVHPENVFEIMRALHRVLLDQPLREKMKERSYRQAAKFSWEKSVRRIMDVYQEVLSQAGDVEPSGEATSTGNQTKTGVA